MPLLVNIIDKDLVAAESWRMQADNVSLALRVFDEGLPSRFRGYYSQLRSLPRRVRRRLQRDCRQSLAGAALLLALGYEQGLAATINVDASCNLVDAITAANTDTTVGGCSAGSGADTIVLAPGSTHVLKKVNNTFQGPTGLPAITGEITIQGNNSTIRRDPRAHVFRLFTVFYTGNLTLQATTVTGGRTNKASKVGQARDGSGILVSLYGSVTLIDSTVLGNSAAGSGGGIACFDESTLTLHNSTVSGNSAASSGGGIASNGSTVTLENSKVLDNAAGLRGGGINKFGQILTLMNTTVSNNTALRGGGISSDEGAFTLLQSTVSGNLAKSTGGGIYSDDGDGSLTGSTVAGNSAHFCGGGIFTWDGSLSVDSSTVSGNSTDNDGGGLCISEYSDVALTNCTFSGNVASGAGGGIATGSMDSNLMVTQCTITGNVAATRGGGIDSSYGGSIELTRNLISGNTAPVGSEVYNERGGAKITSGKYNLFGLNGKAGIKGFTRKLRDIVPPAGVMLSDILAPLGDNTGPTMTHALVPGSPAIDAAGSNCPPPAVDQRGVSRPQQAACDIGAFEFDGGF